MVGPGEVDDLLDSTFHLVHSSSLTDLRSFVLGETKEECQKYGEVEKCLIYEVRFDSFCRWEKRFFSFVLQIPDAPEDEAVRIFVEFKRVESAIKGRRVRLNWSRRDER